MLEKFVYFVLVIIVLWVGYNTFFTDHGNPFQFGPSPATVGCIEPENPYSINSPYYAGFEWGRDGNKCVNDSPLFEEGCSEYTSLYDEYVACIQTQESK